MTAKKPWVFGEGQLERQQLHIYITRDQYQRLTAIAQDIDRSHSAIIRDLIDDYLTEHELASREPLDEKTFNA